MTAKKKSSIGKSSFGSEKEPNLQATALSAIESALIPNLSDIEPTLAPDSPPSLGTIPISLTTQEFETPECEFASGSSSQTLKGSLSEASKKIHVLSSPSEESAIYNRSPNPTNLQVPLHTKYPYWAAIIAALVWLATLGVFFWNQGLPSKEGLLSSLADFSKTSAAGIEHMGWFLLPPLFFFLCAVLYTRGQSIKRATKMMNLTVSRLLEPECLAIDSVTTLSQAVRREVAAIGDGVERALARVGEFETMIRAEIGMLERAYADGEQRIHMLVDKLALQKEEVILTTEDLRASVGDLHKSLTQDLEDARSSLTSSLSEHVDSARTVLQATGKDINQAMAIQVEENTNQLKNMAEMLFVSIGVRCAEVNQQLAETTHRMETNLLSHTNKLSDHFSGRCDEVYDQITQKASDLAEKWEGVWEKISALIKDGVETACINFESVAEKSIESLDEKTAALCGSLVSHTQESQDTLVATGKDVITAMASQTTRIHESLAQNADFISNILKDRGTELDGLMQQRLMALKSLLEDRATGVIEDFKTHIGALNEALEVRGMGLNTSISDYVDRLQKTITHDGAHLLTRVEDMANGFSSKVNGCIANATELFSDHGEKIMHTFENKVRIIGEMLSHHFATFESGAETQVVSFVQSTETLFRRLLATFESGAEAQVASILYSAETLFHRLQEDIRTHFLQNSYSFQEDIGEKTTALSELFAASEQKFRHMLSEKAEQLGHASSEINAYLQETLETATAAIDRSLRYRGLELTEAVAARTTHFEETVSTQLTQFNTNFQDRTLGFEASFRDTARIFDGALDERFSHISAIFDTRGTEFLTAFQRQSDDLAKEVIHIGETIVHTLEARATSVSDILRECSENLMSLLARSAQALQDTIDTTTTRSVTHLVEMSRQVQEDVAHVSDGLSKASGTLKMFISESRTDFLDAEKVLSEQTHSLNLILGGLTQTVTETSEKLLAKMDTLKATTDATLRDTDVLSDKLDAQRRSIVSLTREHAESLTESVRNLENAGIQVTESLSTRKDSLENMLSNVFERTQVITSVTQSLDTDLRHHCTTVETTLEHITEVLSRGARTTVDSLKEHYDLLHSLANESGTQSHQELAHIREHVMHDINSFFSEALDKFNAVSGSIQDVASTIHNNLEATRLQLEQNLVDLPDASEKTSAAMRRVIGDQIKALDTLNGLVKRANIGSSQVLSETDRDTLSDIALIETSSPPRQPLTRGLSATPGLYSSQERGYGPVRAAQKKENLFPSSMAPMAPPEGVDTRWLSPLLERASSKDKVQPPKSPLPTSEHDVSDGRALRSHLALLNTLARDIPKIVDSKRIDDAWASYYRGEPGTFTEALYTPHGQHVFNDVMRLYQESHDFRETVARYIEEFASLLESSSMDGSPSTRRAYLTSDTGKMYTFLAHLSGRL